VQKDVNVQFRWWFAGFEQRVIAVELRFPGAFVDSFDRIDVDSTWPNCAFQHTSERLLIRRAPFIQSMGCGGALNSGSPTMMLALELK